MNFCFSILCFFFKYYPRMMMNLAFWKTSSLKFVIILASMLTNMKKNFLHLCNLLSNQVILWFHEFFYSFFSIWYVISRIFFFSVEFITESGTPSQIWYVDIECYSIFGFGCRSSTIQKSFWTRINSGIFMWKDYCAQHRNEVTFKKISRQKFQLKKTIVNTSVSGIYLIPSDLSYYEI